MTTVTIGYFVFLDPAVHPGPFNTARRLSAEFGQVGGVSARLVQPSSEDFRGFTQLLAAAARSDDDIVLLRHVPPGGPLILLLGLILRLRRKVFVLQVPTPVSSSKRDRNVRRGTVFNVFARASLAISHPFAFLAPHLILQYAPEVGRMSWIGRRKTILLSNPIDGPLRDDFVQDDEFVNIVGVAGSGNSPGFDRVIRGLAELRDSTDKARIKITLVGEPAVFETEQRLVVDLGLHDHVEFTGALYGKDLDDVLARGTIGLGTLAPQRVGLSTASPLKHRTYLRWALPFVTAVQDHGLPDQADWLLRVPEGEGHIEISHILRWAEGINRREVRGAMHDWANGQLTALIVAENILKQIGPSAGQSSI